MHGMTADHSLRYVLVDVALGASAPFFDNRLASFTERHPFALEREPEFGPSEDLAAFTPPPGANGVVFRIEYGVPGRALLRLCARIQRAGALTFFYWPRERAIELIDPERLRSFWRLWLYSRLYARWRRLRSHLRRGRGAARATPADGVGETLACIGEEAASLRGHNEGGVAALRGLSLQLVGGAVPDLRGQLHHLVEYFENGVSGLDRIEQLTRAGMSVTRAAYDVRFSPREAHDDVRRQLEYAAPVPLHPATAPAPDARLPGVGVYLRLDFWAPLTSGGSYGHTVYQAEALSRTMQDFVAIVANPFKTLDELGVRQVVLRPPQRDGNETNIVDANRFYAERLRPVLAALKPAFVFERAVLGNYVGAKLCKELGIPYIVEYNGSEISMMRSFSGKGYEHEEFYLAAEEFSFKQATLVSVVSEHVGDDVARRGVPRERILLNPNAVNLAAYAPVAPQEKRALRAELGFGDEHRVIGFIGTFGGWHGVDVLAEAMAPILDRAPNARFLLIGDGVLKPAVRDVIAKHKLEDRVVDVGRVPQGEGARLLRACDVLVSPHSSHMVDSKFFGSPTKLFEYMGVAAGIVASDLEQIGEVLSPAMTLADVRAGREPGAARGVLCEPGNTREFIEAVLALVENPALSAKLGANARAAAERYYTWDQHVADFWAVLAGSERKGFHADLADKGRAKARRETNA